GPVRNHLATDQFPSTLLARVQTVIPNRTDPCPVSWCLAFISSHGGGRLDAIAPAIPNADSPDTPTVQMAADRKARADLRDALIGYMRGDIRTFEFDDRNSIYFEQGLTE